MKHIIQRFVELFSFRVFTVLGLKQGTSYYLNGLLSIPAIIHERSIHPFDEKMSDIFTIYSFGKPFRFDCRFADENLDEGITTFGIVREVYIQNAYFNRFPDKPGPFGTVVDIGANRGSVSTLLANISQKVIAFEASSKYKPVIEHNMSLNGFDNYEIVTAYVDKNGLPIQNHKGETDTITSMNILLENNNIDYVDFMKMDIEGSEFGLFEESSWLDKVSRLSLEVHPESGDPNILIDAMQQHGFQIITTDVHRKSTNKTEKMNYMYAWK